MASPIDLLRHNSSRTRLREEVAAFATGIPAGARVLDAGAGDAPYRSLLDHVSYESADFEQVDKAYGDTTHVCDLRSIPVEDDRFDAVLFSQVMEHVPDPDAVVTELRRVLRPGGRLFYSGPLFFEEHEQPYDFYRFTSFGVRLIFERAGFEIERLDWLEGYLGTVGHQLNRMARHLPVRPKALGGGVRGVAAAAALVPLRAGFGALSVGFQHLELHAKVTDRGHPKNYVAIAVNPA